MLNHPYLTLMGVAALGFICYKTYTAITYNNNKIEILSKHVEKLSKENAQLISLLENKNNKTEEINNKIIEIFEKQKAETNEKLLHKYIQIESLMILGLISIVIFKFFK